MMFNSIHPTQTSMTFRLSPFATILLQLHSSAAQSWDVGSDYLEINIFGSRTCCRCSNVLLMNVWDITLSIHGFTRLRLWCINLVALISKEHNCKCQENISWIFIAKKYSCYIRLLNGLFTSVRKTQINEKIVDWRDKEGEKVYLWQEVHGLHVVKVNIAGDGSGLFKQFSLCLVAR